MTFDRHLSLAIDRLHAAIDTLSGKRGRRAQRQRARLRR